MLALAGLLSPCASLAEAASSPPSRPPQAPPGRVEFCVVLVLQVVSAVDGWLGYGPINVCMSS